MPGIRPLAALLVEVKEVVPRTAVVLHDAKDRRGRNVLAVVCVPRVACRLMTQRESNLQK